jgi:hypothetical protein
VNEAKRYFRREEATSAVKVIVNIAEPLGAEAWCRLQQKILEDELSLALGQQSATSSLRSIALTAMPSISASARKRLMTSAARSGPVTYIWLVLRVAWRHSFHSAHAILLGLIIGIGLLTYFVPQIKVVVDLHGWQVAALVLGSIVGVRLVLAPYWLWRDQQIENQRLLQQLD